MDYDLDTAQKALVGITRFVTGYIMDLPPPRLARWVLSHKHTTDAYLCQLAAANGLKLATFDTSIKDAAVLPIPSEAKGLGQKVIKHPRVIGFPLLSTVHPAYIQAMKTLCLKLLVTATALLPFTLLAQSDQPGITLGAPGRVVSVSNPETSPQKSMISL